MKRNLGIGLLTILNLVFTIPYYMGSNSELWKIDII